jgi:peptidyl-prolyl cis-trans isomerase SurA
MRYSVLSILLFILTSVSLFAQSNITDDFIQIGKQHITSDEFERIYNKNNSISSIEKQTVEEYLQMFINFKLKVEAAINLGYDTLSSFKSELKGYRDQLAKSYLTDNATVEALINEAYQRMHTEVNASHIMVALKSNPTPADTLTAWNKIWDIRNRLTKGESFEQMATTLSDDPSAKTNKGSLGYFTAFQMVYPFEVAAYNTKIGEISMPVRTRFGYHLLKVNDKRPARGEVHVAHIMFMVPQGSPDSLWMKAEKKIKEIQKKIKEGADFSKLATEYSEDRGSARNGGELPWFGSGRMIPEFEDAAFHLQYPGDVSQPLRTFYGWHIIKLLEKRTIPEFETIKADLKNKITRDERVDAGLNSFANQLKEQYHFKEHKELLQHLTSKPYHNTTKWNVDEKIASQELFSFTDHAYTLHDFIRQLDFLPPPDTSIFPDSYINNAYSQYIKNMLIGYENNQLELKYPEFKNLIQEYHDGILLFNLSDSMVWSKASKDSIGLKEFYTQHASQYMWPTRLEATLVKCKTPEIAQRALKVSQSLKKHDEIKSKLISSICDSIQGMDCVVLDDNRFLKGDNKTIDSITWKKGTTKIIPTSGSYQFVIVHNVLTPMPKTLDEAKGLVISDYQNYLDKEWIKQLHNQYTVSVNQEILNQLKNKYAGKN